MFFDRRVPHPRLSVFGETGRVTEITIGPKRELLQVFRKNPKARGAVKSPAHLQVSSTPDGADIEIDGSFVGNTPSAVGVSAGQHKITVKKSGFNPWERTIAISSGQVSVNATLEPSK